MDDLKDSSSESLGSPATFQRSSSSTMYINPNLSDITDNLEKIKGDAIGDTLYSERSVLKILIRLNQIFDEEWSQELEAELCLLWDMTLDKDVALFIAKQNFLELSTELIKSSSNIRLIEILVGIQGNMSCVEEIRHQFPSSSLDVLLSLFEIKPDAPTLVQVVRLLQSVAWNLQSQSSEGHWFDNETNIYKLSSHLSFVLTSSTSDELLMSSLELVDLLCRLEVRDKDYSFYFSTSEMVRGLVECWTQVMGSWSPEDDFPSKAHHKMAEHWTAILSSFTSHHPGRLALDELAEPIGEILTKLINRSFQFDDCIMLSCVSILDAIVKVYFSDAALKKILDVLHCVTSQEVFNESDNDSSGSELIECIENYCLNVSLFINQGVLQNTLSRCNENHVLLFWKAVNERNPDTTDPGERSV